MLDVNKQWTLTDDDCWQHIQSVKEDVYRLVEIREVGDSEVWFWVCGSEVYLTDYEDADIQEIIESFSYSSVGQMAELYGDEYKSVIAECIFENMLADEMSYFKKCNTFDEAKDAVEFYKNRMSKCGGEYTNAEI